MNIINISDKSSLETATKILKSGGVVIFPTDTVYGIGCILEKRAIRKLYKIKNRPATQPTAVLMTKNQIGDIKKDIPSEFWDGQMTVIVPSKLFKYNFPKMILQDGKIGIRLPKFLWLEKLINIVGPIVTSSANKKGEQPPKKFSEISSELIKLADLTIKTNEKLSGVPSSVYDIENDLKIR